MTSKADELLIESLQRIFTNWKALRLGVENRAGGLQSREKAEWLPTAFLDWTVNNLDLEKFEIEEFIADVLNTEFDLLIDDGSLETTAQQVYAVYKVHQSGNLVQLEDHCQNLAPVNPFSGLTTRTQNPEEVDMVSPHFSDSSSSENEEDLVEAFTGGNTASTGKEGPSTSKNVETVTDEDGEVWQVVKSAKKQQNSNNKQ